MDLEKLISMNNGIITLEELEEIEMMEEVESVESNGLSGRFIGKRWYTVWLYKPFIDNKCDDVKEIQVYI